MRWFCSCVVFLSFAAGLYAMSEHVFVVSEWLPKQGKSEELWQEMKEIMAQTQKEEGCIRAHATRQIVHPGAPGKSKFTIILLQEYKNLEAFNKHCQSDYVSGFFQRYVQDEQTALVEEWTCRLFNEGDGA